MKQNDIENIDVSGKFHGYQEWYVSGTKPGCWYRGCMHYGQDIGYVEENNEPDAVFPDTGSQAMYYIL